MPQTRATRDYLAVLAAFEYLPIATLTLKLAEPWSLPHAMLMLSDSPGRRHFGQWLFNLGCMADGGSAQACRATVVVSDARALLQCARQDAIADRKSVVEGKSVSVRVALGGGRIIKKKKT